MATVNGIVASGDGVAYEILPVLLVQRCYVSNSKQGSYVHIMPVRKRVQHRYFVPGFRSASSRDGSTHTACTRVGSSVPRSATSGGRAPEVSVDGDVCLVDIKC